jgi:hypothetical protein
MILTIIIFFISIIGAFGMLLFRAWEIRTNRIEILAEEKTQVSELSFKKVEKVLLFLAKHLIQWVVLSSVKLWYTITAKIKLWTKNKLPKINKFFHKEPKIEDPRKISFVQRAVIESKIKIKKAKEKIKKDHEEEIKNIKEEVKEQEEKVDKIL